MLAVLERKERAMEAELQQLDNMEADSECPGFCVGGRVCVWEGGGGGKHWRGSQVGIVACRVGGGCRQQCCGLPPDLPPPPRPKAHCWRSARCWRRNLRSYATVRTTS